MVVDIDIATRGRSIAMPIIIVRSSIGRLYLSAH